MSQALQEILFGTFTIPDKFTTRKHSICGNPDRKKPVPLNSKQKILDSLSSPVWKTNKQVSEETELMINRVQHMTAKLFVLGKIERLAQQVPGVMKPVYLYRAISEHPTA